MSSTTTYFRTKGADNDGSNEVESGKQVLHEEEEEEEEFTDSDEETPLTTLPSSPPKALNERHSLEFTVIMIGASALAFNAGFVNGSTYQFRGLPVSHVTGTATKAGMALGTEDYENFAIDLCLIVCFIFGAAISGSIVKHDSFHLGESYGPLFIIGSALFLLACLTSVYDPDSYYYFYFAAMACGLQNSLTTKYSGSIIRTTHMTGASTDIGLTLGRICIGDYRDMWKLAVLVPLFLSFLTGGVVSIFAYRRLGQLTLLINVVVFFTVGVSYSMLVGRQRHIPVWKAMLGWYDKVEEKVKQGKKIVGRVGKEIGRRIRRGVGKGIGKGKGKRNSRIKGLEDEVSDVDDGMERV